MATGDAAGSMAFQNGKPSPISGVSPMCNNSTPLATSKSAHDRNLGELLRLTSEELHTEELPNGSRESVNVGKEIVKAAPSVDMHNYGKKRAENLDPLRVLSSVGAFTVQCASCMKWRLIPTKEQYEEIRQSILEKPFFCSSATSWRPEISCDEPTDVSQDETHLWAIDRPNIPVPPPGWDRQLVFRQAGASKFADVYYVSPSGRKLRSMPEVERFLAEFPAYAEGGIKPSQFSFIIPRPLDSNYCRKRTVAVSSLSENQKKLYSATSTKKSQGGIKRKAFEALSSKEDSGELVGQNTSVEWALGHGPPKKVPVGDTGYESLISQQVVKGSLPPEELMKGVLWSFNVADPKNGNHSIALDASPKSPAPVEAAFQDLNSHEKHHGESSSAGASSSAKEKNGSLGTVPVHLMPSTDPSFRQGTLASNRN